MPICQSFWAEKLHVSKRPELSRKHAYALSLHEAKNSFITRAQLDMPFSFRFKEAAGDDWINRDPWWSGRKARGIQFLPNGTCTIYPKGHPSFSFAEVPVDAVGVVEEHTTQVTLRWDLTWRGKDSQCCRRAFATQKQRVAFFERLSGVGRRRSTRVQRTSKGDLDSDGGNALVLTVNDVTVPSYFVRRGPNWGYIFESCWACYMSFSMPLRASGCAFTGEDAMTAVNCEDQEEEIDTYNSQLNGHDDGDDEG